MPAKRGRTASRVPRSRSRSMSRSLSRYSSTSRSSSRMYPMYSNIGVRNWPYARMGLSQMWDPFPSKATAIMRYSTTISLNAEAGIPAPHLFRANGIQDPDFTGIGHQPYGHDTYQTIYNHYNVRQSTLTMQPTNDIQGMFGISLTDDSTVQGDYDTIRETKGTVYAVAAGNNPVPKLSKTFNVNQNFDLPFQKSTSASFGANPSESMIFHCWCEGSTGASNPSAQTFVITITYIVDMWELKDLGQS